GLRVVDVSDPANPAELGTLGSSWAADVAVWEHFAFVANGFDGLMVVDVQDPASMSIVGSYDTGDWAQGIFSVGSTVYVADEYDGMYVLQFDPTTADDARLHEVPLMMVLGSPWPNPASSLSFIPCRLGADLSVFAAVYTPAGRMVKILHHGYLPSGEHLLRWEAGNCPAGAYVCRITAAGSSATTALIVRP
ncbi:hypothetical protein JXA88_05340, partial [Candidatus Fermentibacteria bacterium]|nr:hypothetical protein [Candidatus Fermentibacteria bacterium]